MGDPLEDSDIEDSFTFGSFTLEDTREFKRNYNGLSSKSKARPFTIYVRFLCPMSPRTSGSCPLTLAVFMRKSGTESLPQFPLPHRAVFCHIMESKVSSCTELHSRVFLPWAIHSRTVLLRFQGLICCYSNEEITILKLSSCSITSHFMRALEICKIICALTCRVGANPLDLFLFSLSRRCHPCLQARYLILRLCKCGWLVAMCTGLWHRVDNADIFFALCLIFSLRRHIFIRDYVLKIT